MLKKLILLFLCVDFFCLTGVFAMQLYARAHPKRTGGQEVTIELRRGPFTVFDFAPGAKPRAIIIFGSGDGGWSGWEELVSQTLCKDGYEVIGIDSANYAQTDYNLATLQADFGKIANQFLAPYGDQFPPVIEGGWSMGAAQAVAVAGGPKPPLHLAGVIAVAALSRGRYGLRLSDKLNILPKGPGTFAVDDFAHAMKGLRIVQMHGDKDSIDSRAWLMDVTAPHRESDMAKDDHYFGNADAKFLQTLEANIHWVLDATPTGAQAVNR